MPTAPVTGRLLPLSALLSAALAAALAGPAHGFVGGTAGGNPGDLNLDAKVILERGLIEPNENQDSWQGADWNQYQLGASYTLGAIGPLLDLYVSLSGTFYTSPAEVNERTQVAAADCLGEVTGPGQCEFYSDDNGALVRAAVGFNFIHTARYALGVSLQGTAPIGVDLDKFANPRVDYLAGSLQLGVQLTDWLSYETNIYVGSGPFGPQNAQLAYTQLFGFRWQRAGYQFGVRVGPYVDADVTERFDDRYDAAYTAGAPEVRDRIRMARFGSLFIPHVTIGDRVTARVTYLQKFFGYDAPATRYIEFGLSVRL